jgi:hypothetical protein
LPATPHISVRLSEEQLDRLRRRAEANGRTIGGEIRFALRTTEDEIAERAVVRTQLAGTVQQARRVPTPGRVA